MLLNLRQIGQLALPVSDVDRSEAFYDKVLGLPKLFRFQTLRSGRQFRYDFRGRSGGLRSA